MSNQQPFIEILTAAFATGEIKSYAISGGYFEILDCAYPVTVNLIGRHGELKGIMRNAEASFYLKGGDYQTITIESPQAQTVRFAFGTSEAGTRRTAGVVSVVDGGRARTSAQTAFMGGTTIAPGVGNYAVTQLWNPLGTGRNIIVSKVLAQISNADGITFYLQNASIGGAVIASASKLGGGVASVAEIRRIAAAAPGYTGQLFGANLPTSGFLDHAFSEPIVLPPGYGLTCIPSTTNNAGGASFEFYQETI